jgi:ATP-dependent Clp protease ATP-binding subunit ClpC
MFERFTDRARRAVVLSQQEARQLGHNYIGTEHLLLGLLAEEEGMAARVLESLDVLPAAVRSQVVEIIGRGAGPVEGHIPFTPRAKKVMELSLREALQLGHNYIGTEHLLLGLVREGQGVAAQVLQKEGALLERVREEVLRVLAERPEVAEQVAGSDVEAPEVEAPELLIAAGVLYERMVPTDDELRLRLDRALLRLDELHEELRAVRREIEEIRSRLLPGSGEAST